MASTTTVVKFQLRRDTGPNWLLSNVPLLEGEPGFDTTNNILKIGPVGGSVWNNIGPENTFYAGSSGLPAGTNYSDYLYYDNATSSWQVDGGNVHIGSGAGENSAGSNIIAIGNNAGSNGQIGDDNYIAIGQNTSVGVNSITIGEGAGSVGAGGSIAIGTSAGSPSQFNGCVAIGQNAGQGQQDYSIAIGENAGKNQGMECIAIGYNAGSVAQQYDYSIAIGTNAGKNGQGFNAIAIGKDAGTINQPQNTIIINASSTPLNSAQVESCFIAPIRVVTGGVAPPGFYPLYWDAVTCEIIQVAP